MYSDLITKAAMLKLNFTCLYNSRIVKLFLDWMPWDSHTKQTDLMIRIRVSVRFGIVSVRFHRRTEPARFGSYEEPNR